MNLLTRLWSYLTVPLICAWCTRPIRTPILPVKSAVASHGICAGCKQREMAKFHARMELTNGN